MYKSRHLRLFTLLIFICLAFFVIPNHVLGFDLLGQIASKVQKYSNNDFFDDKFSNMYSPKFSKDPFGDAMSDVENRSMQLEMAGVEYVENVLGQKGCDLSQKEILGILYYYVPEFRIEFARSIKQEVGDYNNEKYEVSSGAVEQACLKYYLCEKKEDLVDDIDDKCADKREKYRECMEGCKRLESSCCKDERDVYENCVFERSKITASSPSDVKSNCMQFFQKKYKEGQENKEILQQVEVAQIGADKYWNATTDDSPYDIMSDLGILAKLSYYGAEDPITPVAYNIPMFSNSKNKLDERKNARSSSVLISSNGGDINPDLTGDPNPDGEGGGIGGAGGRRVSSLGGDADQNQILKGGFFGDVKGLSQSYEKDLYGDLVEGLNSLGLTSDNSSFYTSLCEHEEDGEAEPEGIKDDTGLIDEDIYDLDLPDSGYQEIVDYMLGAIDDYSVLPEDIEEEIEQNVGDVNNYFEATDPSEIESVKEQIKNCWKSCEGLRVDQKASCMLKCACGEIKSPIFNPEEFPGLGPIFLIRFCAVPAVNTNFSVGGKRIYSIEEGLNEIYGVVDKLSREGKLGKWTQQYEFLDSSTKKINIANTFAFSIDVDFVDITNKGMTHSNQYGKKDLENFNKKALSVYGISNPLNDPSVKNIYRLDREGSDGGLKPLVDLIENSKANRYGVNEESFEEWMDQQAALRKNIYDGVLDYINYSKKLYTKKG